MGADLDAVGLGQADGAQHGGRVAGVEAAGYVCCVDVFHQFFVGALWDVLVIL